MDLECHRKAYMYTMSSGHDDDAPHHCAPSSGAETAFAGAAAGCVCEISAFGSIANLYFFSQLSRNIGDGQAMAWLLEDRQRRERSTSMSSSSSAPPRSPDSTCVTSKTFAPSIKSSSSCAERKSTKVSQRLRHVISRPFIDSGILDTSTHASSTAAAAMVSTSIACPSRFVSVAVTKVSEMGTNAGLLYTDAAYLVLEKATDAPSACFASNV